MNGRSPFCVLTSPFVFTFGSGFSFTGSTLVISGGTNGATTHHEPNVNTNREPLEPRSVNDALAVNPGEFWG